MSRPLECFEYVEGPDCIVCKQLEATVKDDDDNRETDQYGMDTDVKRSSMHDSHDENSSSEDNPASETTCNDDSENESIQKLSTWSNPNTAEHSPTPREKENASGSSQNIPTDQKLYTTSPDRISILCKTIKYRKMPNWSPEEYKKVKPYKDMIEICCSGQENEVRKALDDANTFGEVDLEIYTMAAGKLNCKEGIKWIEQLLDDLQHPVQVVKDKSSIRLQALNLDFAKAAAKTIAQSLLPAKVKCRPNQIAKFLKIIQGKNYILITEDSQKSDHLKLLGIPKDVIEAVRNLEKNL